MFDKIIQKLDEIEQKENIKILHAVESGSRAWGFASPDSDYDVRFIYARPKEFYLRLDKTRDVIEWQLDDVLDINGWDIQKALRLLHTSNPTLFEWNLSPIVYRTTDEWQKISSVINDYFLEKSGLYHYLSTAKSNYREFLRGDVVKYKKYLYVLRPLLACEWILEEKTPPPMLFSVLFDRFLGGRLKADVQMLLDIKMRTPEKTEGEKIQSINDYIDKAIDEISEKIEKLPPDNKKSWVGLNELFLSVIK